MTSNEWHFHDPTQTSKYNVTQDQDGETVTVHSGRNTDWWSTAVGSTPESDAHRDSGPVAYKELTLDSAASWKLSAWISQEGHERFQQTTLFVKLGKDEAKWLKSGIENEDGIQYVGAVSANPYSDWCLTPQPDGHDKVWIEIHKDGADLFIHYSYDGKRKYLLREVKGFCATPGPHHWWLGMMVCGPKSEHTSGTATDLRISLEGR